MRSAWLYDYQCFLYDPNILGLDIEHAWKLDWRISIFKHIFVFVMKYSSERRLSGPCMREQRDLRICLGEDLQVQLPERVCGNVLRLYVLFLSCLYTFAWCCYIQSTWGYADFKTISVVCDLQCDNGECVERQGSLMCNCSPGKF